MESAPAVGATMPLMALKKVVLPAPFGPIRPTSSDAPISTLRLDSAVRPPNRTLSSRARRNGSGTAFQPAHAGQALGQPEHGQDQKRAEQDHVMVRQLQSQKLGKDRKQNRANHGTAELSRSAHH